MRWLFLWFKVPCRAILVFFGIGRNSVNPGTSSTVVHDSMSLFFGRPSMLFDHGLPR